MPHKGIAAEGVARQKSSGADTRSGGASISCAVGRVGQFSGSGSFGARVIACAFRLVCGNIGIFTMGGKVRCCVVLALAACLGTVR